MTAFIDTSVLYASVVRSDGRHDEARRILASLAGETQIVSDHVVVETVSLLAGRRPPGVAIRFWRGLRHTPLEVEHVSPADMERALSVAEAWSDQDFDIVDCTSFAVMERIGCYRAASFDSHFAVYRTGPDRTRAFEIVRP